MAGSVSIKFIAKDAFSRVSKKLNQSLKRNEKAFKALDNKMRASGALMKRTATKMRSAAQNIQAGFAGMGKAAGIAMVAILALGKAVKVAFNASVANERNREELAQLLSPENRTEKNIRRIGKTTRDIADKNNITREKARATFFAFGSGSTEGLNTRQAGKDAFAVAEFASSAFADPEAIAKLSVKLTKIQGDTTAETISLIGNIANFAVSNVEEVGVELPRLLPTLKAAGISTAAGGGLVAAFSGRAGNLNAAVEFASKILETTTNADITSEQGEFLAGVGLPVNAIKTQEFIAKHGLPELLKRLGAIAVGKDQFTAKRIFNTAGALDAARIIGVDPEFMENLKSVQRGVDFDKANPLMSNAATLLRLRNEGSTGTALRANAAINQAGDVLGTGFEAAQRGTFGIFDAYSGLNDRIQAKAEGSGGSLTSGIFQELFEEIKALGRAIQPFDESNPLNRPGQLEVIVNAGPGLSATTGSLGNQVEGAD